MGVLAEIGETLVVVHGQSDQIRLKGAGGPARGPGQVRGRGPGRDRWPATRTLYSHWKASQAELEALRSAARERLREAESLEIALAEIDAVDPQPGEDDALKAEAVKLANVEELRIAASTAHQALIAEDFGEAGDATTLVDAAKRTLEHVAEHDEELGAAAARLAEVGFLLNDIATELASYQAGLDSEGPERLAEIEDRRAALAKLVRKYAPSIDEVLVWAENARARFDELQDDSTRIEALDAEVARAEAELQKQAAAISKIRTKAAKDLSARVSAELKALAMADATLVINVEAAGQLGPYGADEISFLLQPHSGAPARPLGKGASGGELSRVMLAIEVVLAAVDPVPTFVFDEVDAGVGGRAAVEIGRPAGHAGPPRPGPGGDAPAAGGRVRGPAHPGHQDLRAGRRRRHRHGLHLQRRPAAGRGRARQGTGPDAGRPGGLRNRPGPRPGAAGRRQAPAAAGLSRGPGEDLRTALPAGTAARTTNHIGIRANGPVEGSIDDRLEFRGAAIKFPCKFPVPGLVQDDQTHLRHRWCGVLAR